MDLGPRVSKRRWGLTPKRPRWQLSRKTRNVAVLTIGSLTGLVAVQLHNAWRQHAAALALAELPKCTCRLEYDGDPAVSHAPLSWLRRRYLGAYGRNVIAADLRFHNMVDAEHGVPGPGDALLAPIGRFLNLERLSIRGSQFGDTSCAFLRSLTKLKQLYVVGSSALSQESMASVASLENLESLHLIATSVPDAGLAHLRNLRRLKVLDFCFSQISDDGLQHLKGLHQLESLGLQGTRVSDAAVEKLNSMPSLVAVTLSRSSFSHAALARLEPEEGSWSGLGFVLASLDEPTDAGFVGTPLTDVIEFFKAKHEVQIQLDLRALAGPGVSAAMPITHRARGTTLAASLDQILGPLGLTHALRHEVLLITANKSRPHVAGFSPADWKPIPKKLADALDDITECDFYDQPLVDIVDYLRAKHDVEIQIDQQALARAGVSPETPISIDVRGIKLASALALILEPLGLTYAPRYEVLLITSNPLPPHIEVPEPASRELPPTLAAALDTQTELDVTDQPLQDVIENIKRSHALDLRINKEAFAAAGRPTDLAVTICVRNVSLRSVLALVSNEHDLWCKLEGESLVIEPWACRAVFCR